MTISDEKLQQCLQYDAHDKTERFLIFYDTLIHHMSTTKYIDMVQTNLIRNKREGVGPKFRPEG